MSIAGKLKKIVLLSFVLLSSLSVNAKETVIMLVTPKDVFYFQVGKLMKGGQVEIYDPTGKLITTQQIATRETTIELPDLTPGEYIIKVMKLSKDQSFNYLGGNGRARVAMRDEITVSLKLEANSISLAR